jgi:formylglycine-generating enzyme required for sulfatase activity
MKFLHNSVSLIAGAMAASLVPIITASFAKMPHDRWALSSIYGKSTIVQDTLPKSDLLKGAEVLGEFDWDRDGQPEIFAVKSNPISEYGFDNHLMVFRKQLDGAISLDREYIIRDDNRISLYFYKPPDARDRNKVIVDALESAKSGTTYLLQSDIASPVKLGSATDLEVLDLNGDGVYEAVAWGGLLDDRRCEFGFFGSWFMPRIFARIGNKYQCVWPMQAALWREVMSQFADVDNDGRPEIVSLEDNGRNETGAQRLAVYKMGGETFSRIANVSVPWPQIAYIFDVTERGRIDLRIALQEKCKEGGLPFGDDTSTISYEFRKGALQRLPSAPLHIITLKSPPLTFATVLAGRFWMGCSPKDSKCWPMELPLHEVEITRSFELGKYEVTQGQWIKIMGNNPSKFKGDDRRPIDNVSWEDVQIFIKKLDEQNDGYTYRLPTEAEWEYAARAGTTGPFYGKLDKIAWYIENSDNKTHPVGEKQPNSFGLYDMIGNAWEMCSDWMDDGYYASSPLKDPKGPSSGTGRVLRGLSVFNGGVGVEDRVSWRTGISPNEKNLSTGFRLCREKSKKP